ncbi:MAG: HK97 gp10 family phage protein [Ruminococcus sp.]|nr:HK97 gp10 family phage protein [Ruminococcus sp.]
MITLSTKGNLGKAESYLKELSNINYVKILRKYGEKGVEALKTATPVDTGKTAEAWSYEIEENKDGAVLVFKNSNIQNGVCVAILLQYGHGTKNGGYVQGRDYINPALKPIFEDIAKKIRTEVGKR